MFNVFSLFGFGPSFEQTKITSMSSFVSSVIEIGISGLEKKIFKFRQCIFAILLSSIECDPSFEQR